MSVPNILSKPDKTWSPAQSFAYALGAPYQVQHAMLVDALPKSNGALRKRLSEMCRRDWSVESAEDLLSTLNWLGREGHRIPHRFRIRQYCLMRRPAIAARREELRGIGEKDSEARTELWRLDAVQADWHGVRGGVLVGFDAARAVMLVRCGLVLGWLEEGAAWRYLLEMAADVQRSFNSWAEYAADYKLSRALWSGNATPDLFDGIADHLLVAPKSPWRQSAWQIEGLGIPRPVTPARENEPVWVLER